MKDEMRYVETSCMTNPLDKNKAPHSEPWTRTLDSDNPLTQRRFDDSCSPDGRLWDPRSAVRRQSTVPSRLFLQGLCQIPTVCVPHTEEGDGKVESQ